MPEFEWDETKRASNLSKHGIDFLRALRVFETQNVSWQSEGYGEPRWMASGLLDDTMVTVVFTQRGDSIRIISVRRARENERRRYYESFPV